MGLDETSAIQTAFCGIPQVGALGFFFFNFIIL